MAEVARQIGPLAQQVNTLGNNIERLYNSNGGPPGFLQQARREDDARFENEKKVNDGRFDMIFDMLKEFKESIRPLKKFMDDHTAMEAQKAKDIAALEKKSNVRLAILALVFSAISIISANMQGCKSAAHSFLNPPQGEHSALQLPQDSKLPNTR